MNPYIGRKNYSVNFQGQYGYRSRINYTLQHKKAYLETEKNLTGKNTLGGYLHDLDKLAMYIVGVPQEIAHKIHCKLSSHHENNGKIKNIEAAVIDWECARFTKEDKQLTARETYDKFYKNVDGIEEKLKKFGL